ncbi:MAG: hypothetical protein OMM_13840, partial [Candidatus Magnetoglobus multicellularis str. Araruama]
MFHATRNIEQTLSNIKRLLKTNGLLLLNEVTQKDPFTTMTFGLTEGWWLFDDHQLRIPGSPVLTEQSWQTVLESCGFHHVTSDSVLSDQQVSDSQRIMVAFSDGFNIKEIAKPAKEIEQPNTTIEYVHEIEETHPQLESEPIEMAKTDLKKHTINYVKDVFSKVL